MELIREINDLSSVQIEEFSRAQSMFAHISSVATHVGVNTKEAQQLVELLQSCSRREAQRYSKYFAVECTGWANFRRVDNGGAEADASSEV